MPGGEEPIGFQEPADFPVLSADQCTWLSLSPTRSIVPFVDRSTVGTEEMDVWPRRQCFGQKDLCNPQLSRTWRSSRRATTVYIGGQNAVDGDGELVGGDDVAAQTQQVMKNLHIALAAAGASVEDLVMMTVLFVDGVDLDEAYPVAAAELAEQPRL